MIYNCKWYDGFMVDIFVILNVDNVIYFLRWMMFEGFLFNVQNNWRKYLVFVYGEKWFEYLMNRLLEENFDVFNSCEKFMK